MKYIVPVYGSNNFTCPHCNVLAEQKWDTIRYYSPNSFTPYKFDRGGGITYGNRIAISTCNSCHNEHIWLEGIMIIPKVSNVPLPIEGMPEKVRDIYNEARDVFPVSSKAAAALLRLAVQYLCAELGEKGKNINNDIGELVKKGLPIEIQKALDIVRVIGNNAVHPGVLNLDDDNTSASYLFNIINMIVDNRIVQPKKVEEFYNTLPQEALDGIKKRDK